jgi:hypothetical protein
MNKTLNLLQETRPLAILTEPTNSALNPMFNLRVKIPSTAKWPQLMGFPRAATGAFETLLQGRPAGQGLPRSLAPSEPW